MPRQHITHRSMHDDAIQWITSLLIDIQMQLMGHDPTIPITTERLKEWSKYRHELEQCRETIKSWH